MSLSLGEGFRVRVNSGFQANEVYIRPDTLFLESELESTWEAA
jgi:hypothetical protein